MRLEIQCKEISNQNLQSSLKLRRIETELYQRIPRLDQKRLLEVWVKDGDERTRFAKLTLEESTKQRLDSPRIALSHSLRCVRAYPRR